MQGGDTGAGGTPGDAEPLTAGAIVSKLDERQLVDAEACQAEDGLGPTTSQVRCQLGGGDELLAIGFADGIGVRSRLNGWLGGGTLVQGPNWLVNVGDMDAESQEAVRAALGGQLVVLPD